MEKSNVFRSSQFHMDTGDVLHILIKDLVGDSLSIGLSESAGETLEDTTILEDELYVHDIDGNVYTFVTIGSQQWMVENLRTTKYADGTLIPEIQIAGNWVADVTGARCYYNNDEATYKEEYGSFYNYYAVTNVHGLAYLERNGVQEAGWRVPTDADFAGVVAAFGGEGAGGDAGGRMKEAGLLHWLAPNTGADNSSGFTARGAGSRDWMFGGDSDIKGFTSFWTSTQIGGDVVSYDLDSGTEHIFRTVIDNQTGGYSVRLVRDI